MKETVSKWTNTRCFSMVKTHIFPKGKALLLGSFATMLSIFNLATLQGCQPHEGSESQLKEDVDSFATYYYNWHFEQAAKYCTPRSEVWLRYAASNVHPADIDLLRAKQQDAIVELGDVDFHDDEVSATVSIKVTNYLKMDSIGKEAQLVKEASFDLPMVLHQGKWKVELKELP